MSVKRPHQPVPLTAAHDSSGFVCTHESLSHWLQKRALANAISGASRCYVVCDEQQHVLGYYALAAGSLAVEAVPGRLRRNMPDPLPLIVLGRLAVHRDFSGQGIGRGLLKDAVLRSIQAAELIGVRALMGHAIDEDAKAFYLKHCFVESPLQARLLLIGLRLAGLSRACWSAAPVTVPAVGARARPLEGGAVKRESAPCRPVR